MSGYNYGGKPSAQPDPYGGKPLPMEFRVDLFPRTPSNVSATIFSCPTCGKGFKARIALAGHMRSHKSNDTD